MVASRCWGVIPPSSRQIWVSAKGLLQPTYIESSPLETESDQIKEGYELGTRSISRVLNYRQVDSQDKRLGGRIIPPQFLQLLNQSFQLGTTPPFRQVQPRQDTLSRFPFPRRSDIDSLCL